MGGFLHLHQSGLSLGGVWPTPFYLFGDIQRVDDNE